MPAPSFASRLATLSIVKTTAFQWACGVHDKGAADDDEADEDNGYDEYEADGLCEQGCGGGGPREGRRGRWDGQIL